MEPVLEGGRMRPDVMEMARRLNTVCHTPSNRVATSVDTVISAMCNAVPSAEYQCHEGVCAVSHRTLGELDRRRDADGHAAISLSRGRAGPVYARRLSSLRLSSSNFCENVFAVGRSALRKRS